MSYSLYIDESGDEATQVQQISNGASPLFFLGAYLIDDNDKASASQSLARCRERLNNIQLIHFNRMKHEQKVFICREISSLPIKIFGLVSNKRELDRNGFRDQANQLSGSFYNKNVKYLFENICEYSQTNNFEINRIVFERIENKNYDQLKNYIRTCQNNPIHNRSIHLQYITAGNISAQSKNEEPLLQISDVIANSLYKLCIPNKYGHCEPRYLEELKNLITSNSNNSPLNYGLKFVPNFQSLQINGDVKTYIQSLDSSEPRRY